MAPDLIEVKDFLRVDGSYEDGVIQSLVSSAVVELAKSGIRKRPPDHEDYPLYATAVKITVARDFEDRGFTDRDMRVLNNITLKLKDFYPVEVTSDGT